jgi:HEAT repeat protein
MKKFIHLLVLGALAVPSNALAQATGTPDFTVYDRAAGELSPDTRAPTREQLMAAIDGSSPSRLAALLEYGERVECHECVPLLERRILEDADPMVREMAAWWLRRHPFGFAAVYREIRTVLVGDEESGRAPDPDPVRRARAAEALGEFMDVHGVAHLTRAFERDADSGVRVAAVRGLARINSPAGLPVISRALADADRAVVDAALRSVLQINFFRDYAALLPLLAHEDAAIRRRAALLVGTFAVRDASPALAAMLRGDSDEMVRQAAAWALGRIGTPEARAALSEAMATEGSRRVLDAVEVALRMR